jgi:hypothetical protein
MMIEDKILSPEPQNLYCNDNTWPIRLCFTRFPQSHSPQPTGVLAQGHKFINHNSVCTG